MQKFNKLSRAEMKNVMGGHNPNCDNVGDGIDWTCCGLGHTVHLGEMSCDDASDQCPGGLITNDPGEYC